MVAEWRDFTVVTKLIKNFKSLYDFGGRCFNIRDVCMDFEPCFKVYNLVSIRPKSMKLGQMTNLNKIFHMVGSVYRLVTIRNSPQFPVEFRNGLFCLDHEQVSEEVGHAPNCIMVEVINQSGACIFSQGDFGRIAVPESTSIELCNKLTFYKRLM